MCKGKGCSPGWHRLGATSGVQNDGESNGVSKVDRAMKPNQTIAACLSIPLPPVFFLLVASELPCGVSPTRLGLCTLDSAAPAFARASASSLGTTL